MPLLASISISAVNGQVTDYFGSPGAIALPQGTHTAGTGLYAISFVTEREVRVGLPPTVVVTIIDTVARPLVWKLNQAVSIVPYSVAVKYLYTVSFNILVSQVNAGILGLCTTVPTDPDTSIMMRVAIDTFPDKFEGSSIGSSSST
ncbi:MAG: DUF807 family protein [Candidatus Aquirickettsiella sp.]